MIVSEKWDSPGQLLSTVIPTRLRNISSFSLITWYQHFSSQPVSIDSMLEDWDLSRDSPRGRCLYSGVTEHDRAKPMPVEVPSRVEFSLERLKVSLAFSVSWLKESLTCTEGRLTLEGIGFVAERLLDISGERRLKGCDNERAGERRGIGGGAGDRMGTWPGKLDRLTGTEVLPADSRLVISCLISWSVVEVGLGEGDEGKARAGKRLWMDRDLASNSSESEITASLVRWCSSDRSSAAGSEVLLWSGCPMKPPDGLSSPWDRQVGADGKTDEGMECVRETDSLSESMLDLCPRILWSAWS